jgi:hypothetical protein
LRIDVLGSTTDCRTPHNPHGAPDSLRRASNVSKATLRLNINGVTTGGGTLDVYLATKSWTERALTVTDFQAARLASDADAE